MQYSGQQWGGHTPGMPVSRTNTTGLVGFIFSICGLATLMCFPAVVLAITGVVLSSIGLRREPRGLAIAGLVLGIIGLLSSVISLAIFLPAIEQARYNAVQIRSVQSIERAIGDHHRATGNWPTSIDDLRPHVRDPNLLLDPHGNQWRLEPQSAPGEFKLISSGRDGTFGTADDRVLEVGER